MDDTPEAAAADPDSYGDLNASAAAEGAVEQAGNAATELSAEAWCDSEGGEPCSGCDAAISCPPPQHISGYHQVEAPTLRAPVVISKLKRQHSALPTLWGSMV